MNLHDQVPSVLTHGGDSKSAVLSSLSTAADHHQRQSEALGFKSPTPELDRKEVEYPRHVHKGVGEHKVVNSPGEHTTALADGWADVPAEIKQEEKPNNGYTQAGEPPFVLGNSPHPRHLHYEEPEGPEDKPVVEGAKEPEGEQE